MRLTILSITFLYLGFFSINNIYAENDYINKICNHNGIENLYQYNHLMDDYDIKFYKLDLEVSDSSTYISGSVTILIEVIEEPFNVIIFELSDSMSIDSVVVNDNRTDFTHQNDEIIISSDEDYEINSLISIEIFYCGFGKKLERYSGIYNRESILINKNITWTLSEPFNSKDWFPCKQVLTDKADSVYVFITTDSLLKAGSNGILTSVVSLPGKKVRYEWKSYYPIAYYLISIAVGDYYDYSFYIQTEGSEDSLLIQNYIYNSPEYINQNKDDIDKTGDLINLFSKIFGPYPFAKEKYGHAIVPTGGGMEHQTMTTLGNFSFILVAHELAHQWFGDNVTCASWQDIWINEGFASYSEYLANQYLVSQEIADLWMSDAYNIVFSEPGGSIYVPKDDIEDPKRIFDRRLSYKKGAAIIHMIRHEIENDSLFFNILKEFQNTYKDSVAVGADFKTLLEEKTNTDFTDFFNQWYFGEGYPELNVSWEYINDTLSINSFQTTTSELTPIFNTLNEYKISLFDADTSIFIRQQSNYDHYKIFLPGKVKNIQVDPDRWLLMKINLQSEFNIDKKFIVSPNPVENKISIYFTEPVESYKIYISDSSGRIINNFESSTQLFEIYLDSFAKGLYFILMKENDKIYSAKFVKI